MEKQKAIIVDVDGTLADMRGVRGPFEWDKVHLDKPHQDIIDLIKDLDACGTEVPGVADTRIGKRKYRFIILTGRDGVCKKATGQWLADHGVPCDEFFSRGEGDFRKDSIIKSEIYMDHIRPKYDVKYVIDDRDQVVEMWRSLGLRVLQVAPGAF